MPRAKPSRTPLTADEREGIALTVNSAFHKLKDLYDCCLTVAESLVTSIDGTFSVNRRCSLLSIIVALLVLSGCTSYGRDVGLQVTRDHIRAIRLGMTRAEIEALLGKPFTEERDEREGPDYVFLTYSRKPSGLRFYPMLWVHFRNGKVSAVISRRYDRLLVADDVPVYWLEGDNRMESDQDHPGFNELFPK